MNFKFDNKDYDSDKLSDNGKACLARLENISFPYLTKVCMRPNTLEYLEIFHIHTQPTTNLKHNLTICG